MATEKTVLAHGVVAKLESTYSGSTTFSNSTDGVLVAERAEFQLAYATDGTRPYAQASGGRRRPVLPTGRTAEGTVRVEVQGGGSAYTSSSVTPHHAFLLASGFSGSYASGEWTYTPAPVTTTPSSLALGLYEAGELTTVRGAYCNMTLTIDGPAPAVYEFAVQGIAGNPATTSLPAITYAVEDVLPPNATDLQLSINSVTGWVARSISFDLGREVNPRTNINNAAGHAGFLPGRRNPTLTIVVEARSLATFDPYTARANGTTTAVSFQLGSTTGNTITYEFDNAVIIGVEKQEENGGALWSLTFDLPVSGPTENDDIVISYS